MSVPGFAFNPLSLAIEGAEFGVKVNAVPSRLTKETALTGSWRR